MRVVFVSSCVRGGGAGWSLYYLLKHLDRGALSPLVVLPDPGIFGERYARLGVELVIAPALPERTAQQRHARDTPVTRVLSTARNLWDSAATIPWLARLLRERAADLVYCNNMAVKPLGAAAASLADVPCILHARNLHRTPGRRLFYCETVARLPAVRRVIANSEATAAPYRAAVPQKVEVVHNGIDLEEYAASAIPRGRYRAAAGLGGDVPCIGFTGNLIERKGLLTLIQAAGVLKQRGRTAHVAIVGRVPIGATDDYLRQCKAEIDRLELQGCVHFSGFMADVRPAVVDFDVLVMPSLQEPFGRSIIEALALGTPVVASRVGGIPEIIEDGRSGLLVAPQDPLALADALERVLADREFRRALGAGGQAVVRERFDVHVLTRRMQAIFERVAGGARATSSAE